jgi:hypothetical protein
VYEISHKEKGSDEMGDTLIVPLNDYVEFKQKPAYTWIKVVADFGGLLYVMDLRGFRDTLCAFLQRVLGRRWSHYTATYFIVLC